MNDAPRPGEFQLIATLFAPLAKDFPGALGLTDDAALLEPSPGCEVVITTDTMVAGRHFPADEGGYDAGRRLLRVNLSDLASMGARPVGYLLALSLPDSLPMSWIQAFVDGLAADQAEFGVSLIGGDTTSTGGPLTATVTALGEAPKGRALRRSTAKPGDIVYVSGTIGDAALGLLALHGDLQGLDEVDRQTLLDRYRLPLPRLGLGSALQSVGCACADISDGLVADLGHICEASGVGAEVDAGQIPLSRAARLAIADNPGLWQAVLTGGDDYELVFTAPPAAETELRRAAQASGIAIAAIGRILEGAGVTVTDPSGNRLALRETGFRHF